METKVCFKCGCTKSINKYYKHPQMGDGHLGKCIDCTKNDVREREHKLSSDPIWHKKEKKRGRSKYYRLEYNVKYKPSKENKKKIMDRYKKRYPEKMRAQRKSHNIPVEKNMNKHHWSYNAEHAKDVIFIDRWTHMKLHRFLKYNQGKKMYMTEYGELLDTKEKHIEYLESIKLLD